MHATIAVRGISKFLALALALLLASCGGGGGDSGGGGPAPTYTLGGTVSGLEGTGLALRNNGGSDLPVSGSGTVSFTFSAPVASGTAYSVAVQTQPTSPSQTCTVMSNGSGTMGSANVANVNISCTTNTYTIGGTVSVAGGGALGTGLVLQISSPAGNQSKTITAKGTYSFDTPIASGSTYNVTVLTHPSGQTCGVGNASDTLAGANVTNVAVTCVNGAFLIGVTVNGLLGTGLVLQNNLTDNLLVAPNNTTLPFVTPIVSGQQYNVTVHTQPSNPSQTCSVPNGGPANVGNSNVIVVVNCVTNKYAVGGTISGFSGTGLKLRNNNNTAGDEITVAAGATGFSFTTQIDSGAPYAVTVFTQPSAPSQTCAPSPAGSGQGTVGNGNVSINIVCTTNSYPIGGTVSVVGDGPLGTGLALQLSSPSGTQSKTITAKGTYSFDTPIASGSTYTVTVPTNPSNPTQTCAVNPAPNGSGTVTNANVTNVNIVCTTSGFTIGGTVTTLAGAGLKLRNNNNNALDEIEIQKTGPFNFTFATPILSGSQYDVKVFAQPTNLSQTCTVSNGGPATVGGANVTNVGISCLTNNFTVGGTVSGYNGLGMTLRLNGTTNLPVSLNGLYAFPAIPDGSTYTVEVLVQPIQQTCTLTNPTGTLAGANVANITVDCQANKYPVGGTVSVSPVGGPLGTNLMLRNVSTTSTTNNTEDKPISATGPYTFATLVEYGKTYAVTVPTEPINPSRTCTVENAGGTVLAEVPNVNVSCALNSYTIGGTVSVVGDGPLGTGLELQNSSPSGTQSRTISAKGTYSFTTPIASGSTYTVTVVTHPSNPTQTCTVANGGPLTVGGANVTNVNIVCTTTTYPISGTITGLLGTSMVLRTNGIDLPVAAGSTSFLFGTQIASGTAYAVSVPTQPINPTQNCTVTGGGALNNGTGTVGSGPVNNIVITCQIIGFKVGGNVTGLAGTGLKLRNNNSALDEITVSGTGTVPFTFVNPIASGSPYQVTVFAQPANPSQLCAVTPSGPVNMGGADVTNVAVVCQTRPAAPTVSGFYVKRLDFTWPASGATYKFFESTDGVAPYTQVGGTLAAPGINHTIPVHRRLNASYKYQVCNAAGTICGPDSDVLLLGASLTNAIGYVKPSNPGDRDVFGVSLALSSDGNTLAVGAYLEDSAASGINGNQTDDCDGAAVNCAFDSGAVYVFTRNTITGIWSQQAYIKASNPGGSPTESGTALGDQFGRAVALSGDGNTLAVGARFEDSAGLGLTPQVDDCVVPPPVPPALPMVNCAANSGAVYVFTRTTGLWSQQAYLKASNPGGGAFDPIVAPVPPATEPTGTNAYLPGDQFGFSVALNSDGSTLVVGAPTEDSDANTIGGNQNDDSAEDAGAVYVFTRSGVTWTQQAYVKASNSDAGDQFGYSVALSGASGNGTTLAVGARLEESAATGVGGSQTSNAASGAGAVYVFTRSGTWSQQAYVKASNTGASDQFGYSVALSSSGNTLAVGAPSEASNASGIGGNQADDSAPSSGAVYVYTRSGITWSHQAYVKASNTGAGDEFGYSVALSGDGNTLAVGAPNEDSIATGIGGNQSDDSAGDAGAVYVFTWNGTTSTWSQLAYVKVTPPDPAGIEVDAVQSDFFGGAVALSNDGNTLAVGADHQEGAGAGINPPRDPFGASVAGGAFLY